MSNPKTELSEFLAGIINVADRGIASDLSEGDKLNLHIFRFSLDNALRKLACDAMPTAGPDLTAFINTTVEAAFYVGATCAASEGLRELVKSQDQRVRSGLPRSYTPTALDEVVDQLLRDPAHAKYLESKRTGPRAVGEKAFIDAVGKTGVLPSGNSDARTRVRLAVERWIRGKST